MKKIKFFLFGALCLTVLCSCAQQKDIVKTIYATYYVHLPGNIPVDSDGKSLIITDTVNTIFLETASGEIKWIRAWKNDKSYSIFTSEITIRDFNVGTGKTSNQRIIINPDKGKKIWQLNLTPENKKPPAPLKLQPGEIILEGMLDGKKKIIQRVSNSVEINAIPSV